MSPTDLPRILVVDDDPGHLTTLKTIIKSWGYAVEGVDDGSAAVARVRETPYDVILMDVRMAQMSGLEALRRIKDYNPAIPVLIMTAYSSVASAVEALKAGAYDYLTKPLDFEVLKLGIERARDHSGLKSENQALKAELRAAFDLQNIIGRSRAMVALIDMIAMVAPSEATVLIAGESGTGKELIARCLHANSPRRDQPFVVVNCAAITETLLESELFGHEKGAFTGAERRREGRFMQAHQGTIFLDEVGEMPAAMQAKLLRVIQEREIQRVGGTEVLEVDVRILAATHRDLAAEVAAGRFREDLFYRLNVVALKVPPLRERQDDIPLLAGHFLTRYAERNRKTVRGFTPRCLDLLLRHDWPGNVRELENAVERAVILMAGDYVSEKDLPLSIAGAGEALPAPGEPSAPGGPRTLEDIEREAILATLQRTEGNKSKAAEMLGITRKTLYKKLKTYGEE
jgi:two-component system response regulator HydG